VKNNDTLPLPDAGGPNLHIVFIFGTMKQGYPNFKTNQGARIAGNFITSQKYPLYLVGERHSPWLIDSPGQGNRIHGQLFKVSSQTLEKMDKLERIEELDGYRRVIIEVENTVDSVVSEAFVYIKPNDQIAAEEIKIGPISRYEDRHAQMYRARSFQPVDAK
jgi:gamma-glutamylaminecyclotransferase